MSSTTRDIEPVCLVIACYNEARRLRADLVLDFLRERPQASVCFVNDGSSDATAGAIEELRARNDRQIFALSLQNNRGKAEAVRHGVQHMLALQRFAFIGYWDADLATPLSELDPMMAVLTANPNCVLAIGSRWKRLGSDIRRKTTRHYLGRVFATCASAILGLPVYDSQCGAKVFRADIGEVIFGDRFLTDWLFDVEILARLRNHLGREGVLMSAVEVPLGAWKDVGDSKLRLRHVIRMPFDLVRIAIHYNRRRG